ncbi:MAG: arginase family protein, partial [Ignavibacteriaceae bacterium]|nr:arginase family protein [Ignavibacteriaceae bacterium]
MKIVQSKTVEIIGFPVDLGSGRRGVDMGPSAIRIAHLGEKLEGLGYKVIDHGDISIQIIEKQKVGNPKLRYLKEIVKTNELLAKKVLKTLGNNNFPLVLGGDHSMAIGTIAGIASHCK